MKVFKAIALLVSIIMSTISFGQNIKIIGKIKDTPDPEVVVNIPINGNFFSGNNIKIPIDTATGNFNISINNLSYGIITLSNHFKKWKLYVTPAKSYHIEVDGKNPDNFYFSGYEKEGQMMLNQLEIFESAKTMLEPLNAVTDANERMEIADKIINEKQKAAEELFKQKRISNAFYVSVLNELDIYKINLLSTDFFFEYRTWEEEKPENKEGKERFFKAYMPVWASLYQNLNHQNNWLHSSNYIPLLNRYISYLDLKKSGHLNFTLGNNDLNQINLLQQKLTGKMLEYAWAEFIVSGIDQNLFEKEWIQNFEEFKKTFPKSVLTPKLMPYIEKVILFNRNKNMDKAVQFLKDYETMNTTAEVIRALNNGKVTYIDLWATYCVPCRLELQYSKALHDTFKNLGVQVVYISVDKNEANNSWKNMVVKLDLKGVNLRANDKLRTDFDKTIPNFNGIPRYLILNRNGKVVEWDAKRPTDKLELISQLKKYLD